MADFTAHAPGTFSWVELMTTDGKAGADFYRALFGWDAVEHDMGPNGIYRIFTMRGRDVAAGADLPQDERQMGIPSHWNLYVTVPSADEAASRAASLGATVLVPPFDVMSHGRMAVLQDPTGAVFQVWEPKAHIGVKTRNEPNALCWSELTTRDTKKAETFYTQMFGWTPKPSAPGSPMEYTEFSVNGHPAVGMMGMPAQMPPDVPSYWMPYFQASDLAAAAAKAKSLGATVIVGPQTIPDGASFAVLQDPQKAMFALYQPAR